MVTLTNSGRVEPGTREFAMNCMCGGFQDAATQHVETWFYARQDIGDPAASEQQEPGLFRLQAMQPGSSEKELWHSDPITVNPQGTWGPVALSTWLGRDGGPFTLAVENLSKSRLTFHAHIQSN